MEVFFFFWGGERDYWGLVLSKHLTVAVQEDICAPCNLYN